MPVAAFSNTWQLYCFKLFKVALDHLEQCVAELAQQHPVQYRTHPKTRLLASIYKCMTQLVPANPDHPDFRLGKTLGKRYSNWRRVKKGMPDRYRLFSVLHRVRFGSSSMFGSMMRIRCEKRVPKPMCTRRSSVCSRAGKCLPPSMIL